MNLVFLVFLFAAAIVRGDIESPCPKQFLFEPEKSEGDRWYGVISLQSETGIKGVTLRLRFDKSVIEFGNYFGRVESNHDNTEFTIKNEKKSFVAHAIEKVRIFVVYDPLYDFVPPNLSKIVFNGREICPNNEKQEEKTTKENDLSVDLLNAKQPNCGTTRLTATPLITHGQNTRAGDWPWHAAVYLKNIGHDELLCGGTLISERHVLTAAHCITSSAAIDCSTDCDSMPRDPEEIFVILGKYSIYIVNGSSEQTIDASKITVHSQYSSRNLFNDISIIHLKKPALMTNFVRYCCLWNGDTSLNSIIGKIGTVVGWGRDHKNNKLTDLLMQAQMPVVETYTCIYSFPEIFGRFTNNKNNFCAGFRNGTTVCNGDSGGGLMFPRGTNGQNQQWQIRGIVSSTVRTLEGTCDPDYHVIFTDVAKYLDWIHDTMKS